jgi:hypothetical protein
MVGLCNITSGMFFGAGCLIAERIDSNWWQSREAPTVRSNAIDSICEIPSHILDDGHKTVTHKLSCSD